MKIADPIQMMVQIRRVLAEAPTADIAKSELKAQGFDASISDKLVLTFRKVWQQEQKNFINNEVSAQEISDQLFLVMKHAGTVAQSVLELGRPIVDFGNQLMDAAAKGIPGDQSLKVLMPTDEQLSEFDDVEKTHNNVLQALSDLGNIAA